jgi:ubiquinone/menaquinone biosynthesis C-methylase UbiE
MGLEPTAKVLEIGSGPGFFSPYIAAAVPRGKLILADLQAGMLDVARQRLGKLPTVGFVQADAQLLPFAPALFDSALLATVLGEIPDARTCLREIHRVLRPGGLLAVSETRRDSDFIAFGALAELLEAESFDLVERRGLAWQYVATFVPRDRRSPGPTRA